MAGLKVLLVDDEPFIRRVAELALGRAGHDVVCAANGKSALKLARDRMPDVVLLDMTMPGLDGLETLSWFRTIPGAEHVPVIFLTARVLAAERATYLQAGATGVIAKPFDPLMLSDRIAELLQA